MGIFYAISCALAWSLGTIYFRKSTTGLDSQKLTLSETTLALLFYIPIGLFSVDENTLKIISNNALLIISSGVLGLGVGSICYFFCLKLVGASRTAVIECLYLPFTIVLASTFLSESMPLAQMIGILLVMIGVLSMRDKSAKSSISKRNLSIGIAVGICAQLAMASSTVLIKPVLGKAAISSVMILRLLSGLIAVFIFGLFRKNKGTVFVNFKNRPQFKNFLIGVICISCLAPYLWLKSLEYTTATLNSILVQSSTIFTIIFAHYFLKEYISPRQRIASAVAIGGVLLSFI